MQKSVFILGLAFLIGLTANSLLKNTIATGIPIGLGIPFLIQVLASATIYLAFKTNMPLGRKGLYFLIPGLIFSLGFVFRDSRTLLGIDVGVVFLSLAFTANSLMGTSLTTAGIKDYLSAMLVGLLMPMLNAADLLYNCVQWDRLLPHEAAPHVKSMMRGLAIGLPITAVFFALFVSADAAFAAIVGKSIKFDLGDVALQSTLTIGFSWLAAGYFHSFSLCKGIQADNLDLPSQADNMGLLQQASSRGNFRNSEISTLEKSPVARLGITEIATSLGLVNILFAAFVAVQLRFLFGGASLVELTPGLSFAEYARKGFFDLNIAAALVLPLLLAADHLLDRVSKHGVVILRGLSFTLLGLLSVVMASALMRMHLYQTEYGQSELRLYTTAFMAWLSLVCVVFSCTVLAGLRKHFAFAGFVSGLFIISILHLINPDAMIERANISQAKTGKAFDAAYAISLSADGVPALVKQIEGLPRAQQRIIARALVGQHQGAWHTDWRAFNISRMQAYQAVNDNLPKLVQLAKD
jgi:hypothetical protein